VRKSPARAIADKVRIVAQTMRDLGVQELTVADLHIKMSGPARAEAPPKEPPREVKSMDQAIEDDPRFKAFLRGSAPARGF
jgi:hypothetical protein